MAEVTLFLLMFLTFMTVICIIRMSFFKSIIEQVYELSQWEIKYQDDEKLKLSMILMQRIIRLTEEHRNIAGDGLTPLDRLFVSRDYLNVIQGHGTTLLTAIISICSAASAFSLTLIIIRYKKNQKKENESIPLIEVNKKIIQYGPYDMVYIILYNSTK